MEWQKGETMNIINEIKNYFKKKTVIESIKRIDVKDGDILSVVFSAEHYDIKYAEETKKRLVEYFKKMGFNIGVLVSPSNVELSIIRKGTDIINLQNGSAIVVNNNVSEKEKIRGLR